MHARMCGSAVKLQTVQPFGRISGEEFTAGRELLILGESSEICFKNIAFQTQAIGAFAAPGDEQILLAADHHFVAATRNERTASTLVR